MPSVVVFVAFSIAFALAMPQSNNTATPSTDAPSPPTSPTTRKPADDVTESKSGKLLDIFDWMERGNKAWISGFVPPTKDHPDGEVARVELKLRRLAIGQDHDHYCDDGGVTNLCDPNMSIWLKDSQSEKDAPIHEIWTDKHYSVSSKGTKHQDGGWTDVAVLTGENAESENVWTFSTVDHNSKNKQQLTSHIRGNVTFVFRLSDSDRGWSYPDPIAEGEFSVRDTGNGTVTYPHIISNDFVATSVEFDYEVIVERKKATPAPTTVATTKSNKTPN